MSVVVSNSQEISNSPLNLSKSKQLYSFTKEKRFNHSNNQLCQSFYDIPSTRTKRSTSFGYGKKLDLANITCSPAPNKYEVSRDFQNTEKQKGYTISLGREDISFGGVFNNKGAKIPGPGTYQSNSQMSNIYYSIRVRTPNEQEKIMKSCTYVPGPGTYSNPLSLSVNGRYPSSAYNMVLINNRNSGSLVIRSGSSTAEGSSRKNKYTPGPGTYNPPPAISNSGSQSVYKYKSSGACKFAQSGRASLINKNAAPNPGPGFYRLPSEFGYYESKQFQLEKSNSPPKH